MSGRPRDVEELPGQILMTIRLNEELAPEDRGLDGRSTFSFIPFEERRRSHLKSVRDLENGGESDVAFSSFDLTDVVPMQPGDIRKSALGPRPLFAEHSDPSSEGADARIVHPLVPGWVSGEFDQALRT